MRLRTVLVLASLTLAGCGPGPDGLAAGPTGVVAEVRAGDAVVLKGGQVVRLAGVDAPKGDEPFAVQARADLERRVLGRQVQLMFGGARQDAYGRTLAHLKLIRGGGWVEQQLLQAGDVRVHSYADNRALARPMLDEEARARIARRGLWSLPLYQVRLPSEAAADPAGFQLVEGRVTAISDGPSGLRLDLDGWIGAEIPRRIEAGFAASPVAPVELQGRLVRVRGLVRPGPDEPVLRLDHPEQIEVLKGGP